jgi:hypothetical protein
MYPYCAVFNRQRFANEAGGMRITLVRGDITRQRALAAVSG